MRSSSIGKLEMNWDNEEEETSLQPFYTSLIFGVAIAE